MTGDHIPFGGGDDVHVAVWLNINKVQLNEKGKRYLHIYNIMYVN